MDTLYIRLVTLGLVTAKGRIKKRNCPSPPHHHHPKKKACIIDTIFNSS